MNALWIALNLLVALWFALSAVRVVGKIGKPREPLTSGEAWTSALVLLALAGWLIWTAASHA